LRILILSALFPPSAKGGAELCAYNSARWLANQGIEVGVATCAASKDQVVADQLSDSLRVWRLWYPRPYALAHHDKQPSWKKLLWHVQDHCDPRNPGILKPVLDAFRPDLVHIHLLSGFGYNSLRAINRANIPILFVLHDPGLACLISSMYKDGHNCEKQCLSCRISSTIKMASLPQSNRLTLISPSKANLDLINSVVPTKRFPQLVIPNIDLDLPIQRQSSGSSSKIEFLFVGRLHPTKGVSFLLDVFLSLGSTPKEWRLTIVGGGPLELDLRARAAGNERVNVIGRVEASQVKNYISKADVLCFPSLWRENHPGVIREALRAGLPAVVSDTGGSAEMISAGVNGLVLPAGDLEHWRKTIASLLSEPTLLANLQKSAAENSNYYSADLVGAELLKANHAALLARD